MNVIKRIYSTDAAGNRHCTVKARQADGSITFTTIY